MFSIKRNVLESVLEASSNLFPNEFFCLLGGERKKKIIDEFVMIPAEYMRDSVAIKHWLMPLDLRIIGSVHSHPRGIPRPSPQDLRNFAKFGEIHLITFPPFSLQSFHAFDSRGNNLYLNLVD